MFLQEILGESIPGELHDLDLSNPYGCDSRKVYLDEKEIIGSPVFVSKILSVYERSSSVCSSAVSLSAFVFGSEWIDFEVSTADLFDSRKITRILADYGILVTSNTARSVVKYFQSFIQMNLGMLPHVRKYKFTGWNRERFLLPNKYETDIVNAGTSSQYLDNCGDVKLLGSLIRKAWKYTGARLMMDLSLAPILLKHCNVRNFAVNIFGRSGGGKTAALRLANSLWGSPMFMNEFNATVNSLESFAVERNDLPTFINEWQVTDRQNRKQISNSIIHRFGEGRSKARLNKFSELQIVKEFRSILICTAEEPMINSESIQGVRARCLDLEFTPVLGTLSESKMFVDLDLCSNIYFVTQSNYGFIARDFINHVISEKDDFLQEFLNWQETILTFRADILPAHAQYLALVAMIDYRFQKLYIDLNADIDTLEKNVIAFIAKLLPMLPSKESQIDSERAYELTLDWILTHQTSFVKNPLNGIPSPYYGFVRNGVWYVVPKVLRDFLFSEGFDSVKIFREWYRSEKISYSDGARTYGKCARDYQGRKSFYIDLKLSLSE